MVRVVSLVGKYWLPILLGLVLFGRWIWSMFTGESVKKDVLTSVDVNESDMTNEQAHALADRLFDEMSSPLTAYDYDLIGMLKPLTKPDFKKVYEAFGKRYYDTILNSEGGWLFNKQIDLLSWLNYEVTGYVLTQAKKELAHLEIF